MGRTHGNAATAHAGHPLVGLWSWGLAHMDHPEAGSARSHTLLHAGGTFVEANPFLEPGLGLWRATGARTADLLVYYHTRATDADGSPLRVVVAWGPVAVDAAGDGVTFSSTVEVRALDGTVVETGGQTETAVRLTVGGMRSATP